jgi:FAS-associated factor 2
MLAVLLAPFSFGYKLVSGLVRSVFYILSFLPLPIRPRAVSAMRKGWKNTNGRRMLMPRDSAARFKREFEEEYGEHNLPFFDGGHAQAMDAAKRDLKFLLIVLMSPEHDDTESFTRETLLAPEVVSFINDPANNIILWAGNVLDSEAYQVAAEYMCTKYPFSCLVCLTPKEGSTRMGIVKRLAGPKTPEAYIAGLQSAITAHAPDLEGVRQERAAQELARNLRTEQDSAYDRSLARDRERRRQKQEAEAAAAAAEKMAQEKAAAEELLQKQKAQWKAWRATTIAPEPESGVRLALNMSPSSGAGRVIRRFASDTTLEQLYAFVECHDILQDESVDEKVTEPAGYTHFYKFRIASIMPRETLEPSQTVTLGEKLGKGGNLVVEDISQDDEEAD